MSQYSFKVLRITGKVLSIVLAIAAICHNPGHLFTASMLWFGADELCKTSNEETL